MSYLVRTVCDVRPTDMSFEDRVSDGRVAARHEPDTPRVQHTIGGISDALRGSRRAQFFAELLRAPQGQELDDVLNAWWGRAMLDTDPGRNSIHADAVDGTLPTTTIDEVQRRRRERSAGER